MTDRTQRPIGSLYRIAVLALRLLAVFLVVDGVIRAICALDWDNEVLTTIRSMWVAPLGYMLVGMLLWIFSEPIGRLVVRGLDHGPPAA